MKELLQRLKIALNNLDDKDFELIERADTFYHRAIEQIVKHLEWLAKQKLEDQ